MKNANSGSLYDRVRGIIESARVGAARSVNTAQVVSNWMIGREIVEEDQEGGARADYGKKLIKALSRKMAKNYGAGYSEPNLFLMVQFYRTYPELLSPGEILYASRRELPISGIDGAEKGRAAPRGKSWKPGLLHPNLSWTHYRTLLRADKPEARAFYEIEAIKNSWSAREMERQMASLLYERLALSRDKKGLMRLALKGHEARKPADVFKDPMVMEFLGLILCADKNDAVVRYTLGPDQRKTIFASRYKLHLPSEAELRTELRREVKLLAGPS